MFEEGGNNDDVGAAGGGGHADEIVVRDVEVEGIDTF